ncbi:DUF4244 domain-containing protein [Pseudarthrobacter sp. NPDC092424]|uniref:DUF4244 domain-containing protein n=1 Tax=Pseudarthrobacter sp. NPDC092424 TaxID=3364415 RepID=UPI003822A3B9
MYARHYSHRMKGAGAPNATASDRSAEATRPPALRLVQPMEEASGAPSGRTAPAPAPATASVIALPVRRRERLFASEAGMATAEYAIATLAAVGFAGLLVFILRSEEVRGFLLTLIRTALALP